MAPNNGLTIFWSHGKIFDLSSLQEDVTLTRGKSGTDSKGRIPLYNPQRTAGLARPSSGSFNAPLTCIAGSNRTGSYAEAGSPAAGDRFAVFHMVQGPLGVVVSTQKYQYR